MKPIIETIQNNNSVPIFVDGNFLRILSAPSAGVRIFSDDGKIDLLCSTGYTIKGIPFTVLYIENKTGAAAVVSLITGRDAELDVPSGSANTNVSTAHAYGVETIGTTAATVGGTTGQIRITVQADPANTAPITIGTTAGQGFQLSPGDSYSCDTSAALSFISTAAAQSLHYHREA